MIGQAIVLCVIYAVVHIFLNKATEDSGKSKTLKISSAFRAMGYILCVANLGFSVVAHINDETGLMWVGLSLALVSALLVSKYYGFSLVYDSKKFVYRSFFGAYRTVYYREILGLENGLDLHIITKNDVIKIPNYVVGRMAFYEHLKKTVSLDSKTQAPIPRVRKFSESVYRPGEFVFVYIVMFVVGLLFAGLIVWAYFDGQIVSSSDRACAGGLFLFAMFAPPFCVGLSVYAAKRAHASKKWRKVLKYFIKDSYFRE